MSRNRTFNTFAAAALAISLFGACSAESLAERAVEFGLEQAAESNGEIADLDLDFNNDGNGGFSISTDEGDFELNLDGDNGGIVFNTDEGDGVINFDENGIVFNTDEGDGVINFDEDGITFNTDEGDGVIKFDENGIVFDTDEGDGVINFDENGITFQSDEGSGGITTGTDVPDSWPAGLGLPATANPDTMFFTVLDTPDGDSTTAVFEHAESDSYPTDVQARLAAAGWTSVFTSNDGEALYSQFSNDADVAIVTSDGTTTTVSITDVG